jgi:hypothetical protein
MLEAICDQALLALFYRIFRDILNRIINPAALWAVEVDKLWNMAGESIPTTWAMPCKQRVRL